MTSEVRGRRSEVRQTLLIVLIWLAIGGSAFAQSTHLLIVVGLAGTPAHGELFKKWGTTLASFSSTNRGSTTSAVSVTG